MGAVVELTDEEWGLVEHLFDPPVHRGVKGTIPRRDIVDAILWLARTGCQWRHLPDGSPTGRRCGASGGAGATAAPGRRRCASSPARSGSATTGRPTRRW